MKVRFQADADLHHAIVTGLRRREPAVDFASAVESGLPGLDDDEVLRRSKDQGRVLVTHDARTMPSHFARCIESGGSAGVLVAPQHLPVAVVIEELLLIWVATDADEWTARLTWLPL